MIGIEDISLNLSNKLGDRLNKTDEEKSVLNYGLFTILHIAVSLLLTVVVGILTGLLLESLVILFCSAMMKKYSGGVHASSPKICTTIGAILCLGLAILCRVLVDNLNINKLIIIVCIGFIICYLIIYKRCPLPSKNKPMKKESTRRLLRKKAFNLVNTYIIISFILGSIAAITNNYIIKTIMVSILLGLAMQMLALTETGIKLILAVDKLLGGKGEL